MDIHTNWQLCPKIACRTIDNETIIIGINQGEVHLLNDTASFLWNKLNQGPQSAATLVASLLDEYDVDTTTANQDVECFLNELAVKKLIEKTATI